MSTRGRLMSRSGLVFLAVAQTLVGGWQLLLPRAFYDDFPLRGHPCVAMPPAYNEDLMTDVGGLNLALALVFAVAAVSLDRLLVRTVLAGYLLFADSGVS